jgi:hypothetical protein
MQPSPDHGRDQSSDARQCGNETPHQHDTSGIVVGFGLAQRDVPAHDDAVAGLFANVIIGRQPFAFDRKLSLRLVKREPSNERRS